MRTTTKNIFDLFLAANVLMLAAGGCGSTAASSDVAYEDGYSGDYYYPADVGYAGLYGAGFGYYGLYFVTPPARALTIVADGGLAGAAGSTGAAGITGAAGVTGAAGATGVAGHTGVGGSTGAAGSTGGGGSGSTSSGSTTVRGAVGEAIRNIALGGAVCPGQVTVTRPAGTAVCGVSGNGLNIVFNGCVLSAGGTVDGTVNVQFNLTAADTACATLGIGYTSTITNLVYTGTGGAKIVIPSQTDTTTINVAIGQAPATVMMMSSGEIQRLGTDGTQTSDRTYTGTRTFSAISIANHTYTVDGTINVTDKAGGTGTVAATGLQRDRNCCKPIGGTLAVSRTGGSHSGSHSWTFTATCGAATLDGKTVTLPACL